MRYFIILALCLLPSIAMAGTSGIERLITVTTEKSENANDEALQGADKQRSLIDQQKQLRARQRQIEESNVGAGQPSGLGAQKPKPPKNLVLNPNPSLAKLKDLEAQMKALKQKMDSLSDLGEEEQLKLQKMQDHMSKMMALLSNILKKHSDTAAGITQNLK